MLLTTMPYDDTLRPMTKPVKKKRALAVKVNFTDDGEFSLYDYVDEQARINKRSRSAQIKVMLQFAAAQNARVGK